MIKSINLVPGTVETPWGTFKLTQYSVFYVESGSIKLDVINLLIYMS